MRLGAERRHDADALEDQRIDAARERSVVRRARFLEVRDGRFGREIRNLSLRYVLQEQVAVLRLALRRERLQRFRIEGTEQLFAHALQHAAADAGSAEMPCAERGDAHKRGAGSDACHDHVEPLCRDQRAAIERRELVDLHDLLARKRVGQGRRADAGHGDALRTLRAEAVQRLFKRFLRLLQRRFQKLAALHHDDLGAGCAEIDADDLFMRLQRKVHRRRDNCRRNRLGDRIDARHCNQQRNERIDAEHREQVLDRFRFAEQQSQKAQKEHRIGQRACERRHEHRDRTAVGRALHDQAIEKPRNDADEHARNDAGGERPKRRDADQRRAERVAHEALQEARHAEDEPEQRAVARTEHDGADDDGNDNGRNRQSADLDVAEHRRERKENDQRDKDRRKDHFAQFVAFHETYLRKEIPVL